MNNVKEFLYVGHYYDVQGRYILKVGTTNDLEARRKEHNRYYRNKARKCPMPKDGEFVYDFSIPLSKYNTLRFEDRTKAAWKNQGVGQYVNNDRFICEAKPEMVEITIRKTYKVAL